MMFYCDYSDIVTLKRTSGSLRLPNLNRKDGERTALRSI